MDWKTFATLAVSVALAFAGYFATYLNNLKTSRRKDSLDRINRQLKELYGPMFALCNASQIAWDHFRANHRPGRAFWNVPGDPPTPEEAVAWRIWMKEVFIPIIFRMEALVLANSDLIDQEEMPPSFVDLCAHTAGYRVVMKKWENGDFSENVSSINFPKEVVGHVSAEYQRLKKDQARLLALATRHGG